MSQRAGLYERMAQKSGRPPAYHEGWDARRQGWPVLPCNTEPYKQGWEARRQFEERSGGYSD